MFRLAVVVVLTAQVVVERVTKIDVIIIIIIIVILININSNLSCKPEIFLIL